MLQGIGRGRQAGLDALGQGGAERTIERETRGRRLVGGWAAGELIPSEANRSTLTGTCPPRPVLALPAFQLFVPGFPPPSQKSIDSATLPDALSPTQGYLHQRGKEGREGVRRHSGGLALDGWIAPLSSSH